MRFLNWLLIAGFLTAMRTPHAAIEAPCPSILMTEPGRLSNADRLRFLEEGLARAKSRTRVWANAWGIAWASVTLGSGIAAVSASNTDTRQDSAIYAASSGLGLIPTWIFPPKILEHSRSPKDAPICAQIEHLESVLDAASDDDRSNRGWQMHTGNVAFNLALGAIIGWGLGHRSSALWSVATGIPLGEAQILSYPAAAAKLEARYSEGRLAGTSTLISGPSWAVIPLRGGGGQLQLAWVF